MVAQSEGKLVGHTMFTDTYITDADQNKTKVLLLSPLSVLLEYRNMEVGSKLVTEGFRLAKEMGYKLVFVCGDPDCYNRFGFQSIALYGLANTLNISLEYVMVHQLVSNALDGVTGTIDCC